MKTATDEKRGLWTWEAELLEQHGDERDARSPERQMGASVLLQEK